MYMSLGVKKRCESSAAAVLFKTKATETLLLSKIAYQPEASPPQTPSCKGLTEEKNFVEKGKHQ
jgi:hypothetical protein